MNTTLIGVTVSLLLLAGMLLFTEIGYRLGKSGRFPNLSAVNQGILTVDAAVFGLLGLTLAFTFAGASERLATRRGQIVFVQLRKMLLHRSVDLVRHRQQQ